jgi:hypothetical protein
MNPNALVTKGYPVEWVLESYFYLRDSRMGQKIRDAGQTIFLDSGAFSMFTKGVDIKLEEYAEYIHANKDIWHVVSNLDDTTKTPQISYDNQKALESLGCGVQPVFHCREDERWLQRYLDEGYDYLFIGGMVPETTKYLTQWLDHIWENYLINPDGSPRIKVHGFGLTTLSLMFRYPWYSVDSTSWVMASRMGKIFVDLPHKIQGVAISDKSPRVKDTDQHYDSLSPSLRQLIDQRFEELGYKADNLRTMYGWRDKWNIQFFERMQDRAVDKFQPREMRFF